MIIPGHSEKIALPYSARSAAGAAIPVGRSQSPTLMPRRNRSPSAPPIEVSVRLEHDKAEILARWVRENDAPQSEVLDDIVARAISHMETSDSPRADNEDLQAATLHVRLAIQMYRTIAGLERSAHLSAGLDIQA